MSCFGTEAPTMVISSQPEAESTEAETADFYEMSVNELGAMGIMCKKGSNGDPKGGPLPELVIQIFLLSTLWFLQTVLLQYLYTAIEPFEEDEEHPPTLLVAVAIYVHVISCFSEFSVGLKVIGVTSCMHQAICRTGVVIFDVFVISCTQAVVGGLFIYSSKSVADVVLNSVGVSFISSIDDTIVTQWSLWGGEAFRTDCATFKFPSGPPGGQCAGFLFCFGFGLFPMIPIAVTWLIFYLGGSMGQ